MCEHQKFKCEANINRLTDVEGGSVTGYSCDVRVYCNDCDMPFQFIGLDVGLDVTKPTTDPTGGELRIPIKPGLKLKD